MFLRETKLSGFKFHVGKIIKMSHFDPNRKSVLEEKNENTAINTDCPFFPERNKDVSSAINIHTQ